MEHFPRTKTIENLHANCFRGFNSALQIVNTYRFPAGKRLNNKNLNDPTTPNKRLTKIESEVFSKKKLKKY